MESENLESQPDLEDMENDANILANKENMPSDESPVTAQLNPAVSSSPAIITVEPPSPDVGITGSDPPSLLKEDADSHTGEVSAPVTASSSTPTLTVRERVREYASRAGAGGDNPEGNSPSSSHSSIRAAFDKEDKEWILAASSGDINTMRRLLHSVSGGNPDSRAQKRMVNYRFPFNGFTALHFAAKLNRPDCCRFLLDNGANPDAKTYAGQTALHLACFQECREAVEFLFKHSSRASHTPDYSGKLPHELIRNREAFADILYPLGGKAVEKRGSFLGELPNNRSLRADDSNSLQGVAIAGGGGGGGAVAATSSWLSGVRASFRGKSGSQTKLSAKPSSAGAMAGGASGHQTGRVASIRNRTRLKVVYSSDDSDN